MIRLTAGCILLFIPVLMALGQGGHGRARLTGRVTDKAGKPIASAKIQLTLAETTDAFGNTPFRKVERRDSGYFKTTYQEAKEAFLEFLELESNSTRAAKVKKTLEDLEKIRK